MAGVGAAATPRAAAALVSIVMALSPLAACGSKSKLVPLRAECLQAAECEPGLACVPLNATTRICESDLSGVQKLEDAAPPPDGSRRGDGGEGGARSDGPLEDGMAEPDAPAESGGPLDAQE